MENKNSTTTATATLTISDNLQLSDIAVPEIPKDIIFPDELNKYLRDQVQSLTHQNGMLYKNLLETEAQLKESSTKINGLSSQLKEYETVCPKNSPASSVTNLASSKIVELSKKLRERNSEVEIYKTKCSKLQKYIIDIEKAEKGTGENTEPIPEKPKNELEEQIRTLNDKLNGINMKLCEARNSNLQLKTDLKVANKLLQQEVGETFENFQAIVNSNPNWRGRAQIICDLQQKNSDLREKVKMYQEKEKGHIINEAPVQTKWSKQLETLTKENAELKNTAQDFKKKLDAARARNKVLESEYSVIRAKMSAVMEQNERDRDLITSLTAKVSQSQEQQNETIRSKQIHMQKIDQENKDLQVELSKLSCKMNNVNALLEEQNREIENLRKKARAQQQPFTPRNVENVDKNTFKLLEAERLRLLELTRNLNERVESERISHAETESKFRVERQKAAKLEAKVARLQLEQKSDLSSNYSSYSLKSKDSFNVHDPMDRLQLLEETVKALESKVQIERQEHRHDIAEFTKILENYGYVCS